MISIDVCKFDNNTPDEVKKIKHWNKAVGANWPVVYIINNDKEAYVGETVSAARRMEQHLQNKERQRLTQLRIVSDKHFNKSVILDLEAFLIKYMASDGKFKLQNGNSGIQNHEYYNKSEYEEEFRQLWTKLRKENIVKNSLAQIENSELYKYSPYKSLGDEQIEAELNILNALLEYAQTEEGVAITVQGGAGTGKTILAIYLMKLIADTKGHINTEAIDKARLEYYFEDEGGAEAIRAEESVEGINKIGIVVPQKSLQSSLKDVFKSVIGLNKDMVLSPAEVVKNYIQTGEKYDLLIVDEAHRLKCRYKGHLSSYTIFDNSNKALDLDPEYGTELDWILTCSKNQIFFRDGLQAIRPCDICTEDFAKIVDKYHSAQVKTSLSTQWRCQGGDLYIDYLKNILNCSQNDKLEIPNYDAKLFKNCDEMIQSIKAKEVECEGLCRVAAGFAWPWNAKKDATINDVKVQGKEYHWNSTYKNWITTSNAINEIGCIHTLQGYDLNYAGIIIGEDIKYDPEKNAIYPDKDCYFDQQGKSGVASKPDELKELLLNIYLTLLTRGIKGTYIYVCNEELREYMSKFFDVV